ncbi:hypothetical protein [Bacillus sp. KH172YL63]|uniref:hypothetical protein n=1 Tax=Bacillus sp. KH172YL63 TaxID=2709784 RepID=UPI0013E4916E|nr:hypothetical protein [Bacillus sp. KH172YL63]BCB04211.1 hypothetical protein KH172YL63_23440 [Bacillus sp. KH172YL63]
MLKNMNLFTIIMAFIVSFINFAQAYNSLIEDMMVSFYFHGVGGTLIFILHMTALIYYVRDKKKAEQIS